MKWLFFFLGNRNFIRSRDRDMTIIALRVLARILFLLHAEQEAADKDIKQGCVWPKLSSQKMTFFFVKRETPILFSVNCEIERTNLFSVKHDLDLFLPRS